MTQRHRQLVVAIIAATWGYFIHRDVIAFGHALYQLLQSSAVILITGVAALAVTYILMNPSVVRTAARDARKTVTQTGRDIVNDISGRDLPRR